MVLKNKLNITDQIELNKAEEKSVRKKPRGFLTAAKLIP